MKKTPSLCFGLGLALLAASLGCAATHPDEPEAAALPADLRADYAVFALRCSKCHSLARPLNSGIDSDEYWKLYVERMRRQPASGISVADTVPILRFLHAYSAGVRKRKQDQEQPDAPEATPAATPAAPTTPAPAATPLPAPAATPSAGPSPSTGAR